MSKRHLLESVAVSVAFGLFLWGLLSAFQFPIYSDEFAYRLFLERLFVNGGFKQSVTPYCTEGFLVAPPFWLVPAAVSWSALSWFGGGFWSFRVTPCLCWIVILAVLYAHGRRHSDQSFWPLLLLLLVGPSIYGLVLLRPEIVVLMLGVLIYFWGSASSQQPGLSRVAAGALLLIFAYGLALYMHPKSIYLAPALIFAFVARARGLPLRRVRYVSVGIGCSLIGLSVLSAVSLHKLQYMSCEAYPSLAETMRSQAVNPLQLFSQPHEFFAQLGQAFSSELWAFTALQVSYWQSYEVAFLPGTVADLSFLLSVRYVVITVLLLVMIAMLAKLCGALIFGQQRPIFWPATLLLLVGIGLIGPFGLNLKRHFYDVSLLVGSVVILGCLTWALHARNIDEAVSSTFARARPIVCCVFVLLGAFGTWMNLDFFKQLKAGYEVSSISLRKLRAQKEVALSVKQSLDKLGISTQVPLLIDDWTYDMVWEHPRLYPITYLSVNPDVTRNIAINLKNYNVNYGVTRCRSLLTFRPLVPVTVLETIQHPRVDDICLFKISDS